MVYTNRVSCRIGDRRCPNNRQMKIPIDTIKFGGTGMRHFLAWNTTMVNNLVARRSFAVCLSRLATGKLVFRDPPCRQVGPTRKTGPETRLKRESSSYFLRRHVRFRWSGIWKVPWLPVKPLLNFARKLIDAETLGHWSRDATINPFRARYLIAIGIAAINISFQSDACIRVNR